jgi:hypothetical protein
LSANSLFGRLAGEPRPLPAQVVGGGVEAPMSSEPGG